MTGHRRKVANIERSNSSSSCVSCLSFGTNAQQSSECPPPSRLDRSNNSIEQSSPIVRICQNNQISTNDMGYEKRTVNPMRDRTNDIPKYHNTSDLPSSSPDRSSVPQSSSPIPKSIDQPSVTHIEDESHQSNHPTSSSNVESSHNYRRRSSSRPIKVKSSRASGPTREQCIEELKRLQLDLERQTLANPRTKWPSHASNPPFGSLFFATPPLRVTESISGKEIKADGQEASCSHCLQLRREIQQVKDDLTKESRKAAVVLAHQERQREQIEMAKDQLSQLFDQFIDDLRINKKIQSIVDTLDGTSITNSATPDFNRANSYRGPGLPHVRTTAVSSLSRKFSNSVRLPTTLPALDEESSSRRTWRPTSVQTTTCEEKESPKPPLKSPPLRSILPSKMNGEEKSSKDYSKENRNEEEGNFITSTNRYDDNDESLLFANAAVKRQIGGSGVVRQIGGSGVKRPLIPPLGLNENNVGHGSWLSGEATQGDTYSGPI